MKTKYFPIHLLLALAFSIAMPSVLRADDPAASTLAGDPAPYLGAFKLDSYGGGTVAQSGTTTITGTNFWGTGNLSTLAGENVIINALSAFLQSNTGLVTSAAGNYSCTGDLAMVNTAGFVFSKSASVEAANVLISTLNVDREKFLDPANRQFEFFKDGGNAFIINAGRIAAQPGGYIALLSQAVKNTGTLAVSSIEAKVGRIVLASGEQMTVSLDDKSLISVAITKGVETEVFGPDGKKMGSAIENTGSILADGARVTLTAKSINKVFDYAINNAGIIQANNLVKHDGVIELVAEGAPILNDVTGTIEGGKVIINAGGTNGVNGTDLINLGKIISQDPVKNLADEGSIYIKAINIQQDGKILSNGIITIDVDDITTTQVIVVTPESLAQDPTGESTLPKAVIQGKQVKISFKKLGTSSRPIQIKSPSAYLYRRTGDINIMESLGIGTSILVQGPPADGFSLVYSKDSNLTLDASHVNLVGSDPVSFFGNITFHNFVCATPGKELYFEAGKTYTFLDSFLIRGSYGQHVKLLSSADGQQWFFDAPGAKDITYAWVKDSYNLDPVKVIMTESTNRGNSFNWDPTGTWTGAVSSLWSDTGNWSGLGGALPGVGDDVVFGSGSTATVDIDASVNSVTLNGGASSTTITINPGKTLTVAGAVIVNNPTSNGQTNKINVGSAALIAASLTIKGGNGTKVGEVTVGTGTITISGNIVFTGTAGNAKLTSTGASTINVGGDFGSGGTFVAGTGTVNFNGSSDQTFENYTYYNIVINTATATVTVSATGDTTVNGNITITQGIFDPAAAGNTITGSGTNTLTVGANGTLRVRAATFAGSYASFETRTFNVGSTVDYSRSGAQTIDNTIVYSNLTTSGNNTKTLGGNTTVNGDVTVGSGTTLDPNTFTLTGSGTNTLTVNGTINAEAATFAGSYASFETRTLNTGSTVNYSRAGNQTIDNTITYSNLSTSGGSGSKTLGGATTVTGNVTIGTGTTLDTSNGNNYSLIVGGNWTNNGTFTARSGTVTFNGTGTINAGGDAFYNLVINTSGTTTLGADATVNHDFTVSAGIFDPNGNTITGSGTNTLTVNGTIKVSTSNFAGSYASFETRTLNAGSTVDYDRSNTQNIDSTIIYSNLVTSGSNTKTLSGATTVMGNLTIGSGTTLDTSNGNNYSLTIGGNWTNNGTFTARSSTVTFNGTGTQTLTSGGTGAGKTFFNLTYTGVGTLQLAANNMTATGALSVSSGTFDLNGLSASVGSVSGAGNIALGSGTLTAGSDNTSSTFSGVISGAGQLTKTGTGTLILSGANTYTGLTTVSAGVLNIQNASALGTGASGTTVSSGAALEVQGGITITGEALTLNGTGISSTGALKNISGSNTWTGAVTLGSASSVGSDSGTLSISGNINNAGFLLTTTGSGNSTLGGVISGTGGLTKNGTGTLTVSGTSNSFSGAVTLNAGTTVVNSLANIGSNSSLGTGSGTSAITIGSASAATLDVTSGPNTSNRPFVIGGSGGGTIRDSSFGYLDLTGNINNGGYLLTFDTILATITVRGVISGAGGLTKNGAGGLFLDNAGNTFSGAVTLNEGRTTMTGAPANIGVASALGTGSGTSTITLGSTASARLDFNSGSTNRPITIGGSGGGTISGSSTTLTGAISGNGNPITFVNGATTVSSIISGVGTTVTLDGGSLVLSGANTYSGGTVVSSGTLKVNNPTALGTGTLTATAVGNTVEYSFAGDQAVKATAYYNLTLSGSGVKSLAAGTSVAGTLSIAPTGTATASVGTGLNLSVGSLTLGSLGRINGTWGSTSSGATYKNNTYFAATTGYLTVTTDTRTASSISTLPTASTITYGQTLASSTLSGGSGNPVGGTFTWTTSTTAPNAGTASQSVTYTPTDLTSYTAVTGSVNVTVNQAALTITANDANKTYGTAISGAAGSTAFTSSGLKNGETIGSVTIAYGTGAAATDNVATYASQVTPSAATGGTFTASNYSITYAKGAIVVGAAPLTVTADNQTKVFGTTFAFTGSEFTSSGLVNGETIGSVTLTSAGAPATATVAGSPYAIVPSAATGGTFTASNYAITYTNGTLTVTEAAPVPPTPGTEGATNQQVSAFVVPRYPAPDQTDMTSYQVNSFTTPQMGPVYFYQPPTPYDMAAFDTMMLGEGDLQFLNGLISLAGHEGLMPDFDERRRPHGVS